MSGSRPSRAGEPDLPVQRAMPISFDSPSAALLPAAAGSDSPAEPASQVGTTTDPRIRELATEPQPSADDPGILELLLGGPAGPGLERPATGSGRDGARDSTDPGPAPVVSRPPVEPPDVLLQPIDVPIPPPPPMPAESRAANALWLWLWGPLLVAVVVVAFLGGMASAPIALPEPIQAQPATLVDDTGRTVSTVQPPAPAEQLPIDQVPDILLRSVVATQDPGYFSRHGVAVTDLLAAAAADLVRVRRHGTTIEERYARQVQVAAGSVVPSLRESTVAARLSQHLSPRALLTRYVNGMYFGNGVYGVAAASRFYFDVPVTQLGIPQTAMLVGIAADPSRSNPVAAPGRALAAEQQALAAMRRANVITAEQAQAAAGVRLEIRPHRQLDRPSAAPDFTALVESALLSRFGEDAVYGQNLRVTTSLDLDLQAALDDTLRRLVPSGNPATLALATDPRTGDVRALVVRGMPGGAAEVLFRPRPLGTLLPNLSGGPGANPIRLGDPTPGGPAASVGDVASAVGAVADGGVRHDLREISEVQRPASADSATEVLDVADPLPPGDQLLSSDAADQLTDSFRAAARAPGPAGSLVPFALAGVGGGAGPDSWYAGCVPTLCLTVWTGPQGPTPAEAPSGVLPADSLARQIVAGAFEQYLTAAPDRLQVPPLPVVRPVPEPTVRPRIRLPRATLPTDRPVPVAPVRPAPTASPSASPRPSPTATATPTPTATASPSPSAGTGGGTAGGAGSGSGGKPGSGSASGPPVADGRVPVQR